MNNDWTNAALMHTIVPQPPEETPAIVKGMEYVSTVEVESGIVMDTYKD